VLSQEKLEFSIDTNPDALLSSDATIQQREKDRLRDELRRKLASLQNQRAGIVLTFGVAPTPYEGGQLAQEVNELLRTNFPDIFGRAVLRDFHNIEGDTRLRGRVEFEVYLIIGGD
jgi:hypothetical protein